MVYLHGNERNEKADHTHNKHLLKHSWKAVLSAVQEVTLLLPSLFRLLTPSSLAFHLIPTDTDAITKSSSDQIYYLTDSVSLTVATQVPAATDF